ncbi:tetratricopeptide repeat protein [Flavobacterium sp. PL002]|uniref:type IX secretion system periplasmic lipoprotein PorW/SprE n=1 Tax=Flavobacterium sp. PL002 TaxID=1897058 RepID=UPI0019DDD378|nr:hypothetical protein [Flavobacterium sp. PL002]
MKTPIRKVIITFGILFFLVACSTKRNTFLARNSHALSTEYNILYNGQIGLDKAIQDIKANTKDNFWMRLPIEKMQVTEEVSGVEKAKNPNLEIAEAKATKAIQKHSMNIDGKERNTQIDEAYLLLGKARYFDQRFIPALDAFNFILYKYSNSSKIYEAKIWREKTNMRLGNDALVINNITRLLGDKQLKKQVFSDANALMSEAFLNLEEKDSAVAKLKLAIQFSTKNEDKARYHFILGQLYEELGKTDSAGYSYNAVIKMNRKSERKYVAQSHVRKTQLFDYKKGDTILFLKHYKKLLADRENRPYLDVLNYQLGVFYDKQNKQEQAKKYYNISLSKATTDDYLMASDYRNLGNMYFKNTKYPMAAKYYDSTLVKLNPKTREFVKISKIRKDLDEVIMYEDIAVKNDSILNLVSLNPADRIVYFQNHIDKLKKADEAKRILEEKEKEKQANIDRNSAVAAVNPAVSTPGFGPNTIGPPALPSDNTASTSTSVFYFYNPTTVAYGKVIFKKTWGNRAANGNWRLLNTKNTSTVPEDSAIDTTKTEEAVVVEEVVKEEYKPDFYLKQIPTEQKVIDSIGKERNTAYYQLGLIYKEKFKEYDLASTKLEKLLLNNPEEKLILPTKYNLYKIYQITNKAKALAMQKEITAEYPDSRYAQIINNVNQDELTFEGTPDNVYNKLYKLYEEEQYVTVLESLEKLITQYSGEEIVSKFELLKAQTVGKLQGVAAYKTSLQYVATNYPNTDEGKGALEMINTQIPVLEKIAFTTKDSYNWKILYKVGTRDEEATKILEEKIKKWIIAEDRYSRKYSFDVYTGLENFITIHGAITETEASKIVKFLRDDKEYKITTEAVLITNENYKVIQINKNLKDFLEFQKQ